ncbi:hypothetical protein [Actinomadura hibisca]|uniref:hypothetical protein n=1 Tax=Actinomadura hibisca TaxID=68565 RepID=UPI00082D488D|nr:hypothetical protein [Actinomadura hibisca]
MKHSQHRARRTVAMTGLATALVSASACGTQQASVSSSPQLPPLEHIAHVTSSAQPSYPLDAYTLSLDEVALIEKARVISARRCLSALGFTKPALAIAATAPQEQDHRVVEYLSPKTAAKEGYGGIITPGGEGKRPIKAKSSGNVAAAYLGSAKVTSTGRAIPQGGCFAEGDRKVKASAGAIDLDPRQLLTQAAIAVMRDSRFKTAETQWSECMKARGHNFQNHVSAQLSPKWDKRSRGQVPSAEERKVAAQDAECRQQVNLVGIAQAVEIAHQKKLVNDNQARLLKGKRVVDIWLHNAKTIIARG